MKRLLLILSLFPLSVFANTFTEFYVQTTGDNLNSGSSSADTAAFTYTSKVVVGGWDSATGIFTVATGNPSGDGVTAGMFASVYVTAGATVATFIGRITTVTTTTFTVSLLAVAGTPPATDALGATTAKIGGAWKGPNGAVDFPCNFATGALTNSSGNSPCYNFKGGVLYSITDGITNVSNTGPQRYEAYTTTLHDGGFAQIDGGGSGASFPLLFINGAKNHTWSHFIFANNGTTGTFDGVWAIAGNENMFEFCVFHNIMGNGIYWTNGNGPYYVVSCEAYFCNMAGSSSKAGFKPEATASVVAYCFSHDNTNANSAGFQNDGGIISYGNIALSNAASGFRWTSDITSTYLNNVSWGNGGGGFESTGAAGTIGDPMMLILVNNITGANVGAGFRINNGTGAKFLSGICYSNAFGTGIYTNSLGAFRSESTSGGVSGDVFSGINVLGNFELAADTSPFANVANGDFRINLAVLKGKGFGQYLQTMTGRTFGGTVAYPDIGTAQHADSQRFYTGQ